MDMDELGDIVELFKEEVTERLSRVEEELVNRSGKDIELIYREFHTIKGTAQMLGFENYSKAAHKVEDVVKPLWKQNASLPQTEIPKLLKVLDIFKAKLGEDLGEEELERIDRILSGQEEEEETKEEEESAVIEITSELDGKLIEDAWEFAKKALFHAFRKYHNDKELFENLQAITDSLREIYWRLQTIPLKDVLKGFDRLVYEEASREKKKVRFELNTSDVRIKKEIASAIRNALVHIVKNAVVHGIEPPEERIKKNKNEEGIVRISSWVEGRKIVITVEDDGKGIDFEKIKAKLSQMGKDIPQNEEDLIQVIFDPFFSTKERADLGGGRGVGLSSVKTFIESSGGKIRVKTQKGKGTKFIIDLPSTKVWEKVMILRSGISTYAVRMCDVKNVRLYEVKNNCAACDQFEVVLKNGACYKFDTKVMEGEFVILENPFRKFDNVAFWIDFLGIPIPVFKF